MAIVKILSRHSPSYSSLIGYVMRYIVNEGKTQHEPVYTSNLRSDSMAGYADEFIMNESFRRHPRTDRIHLFHEIVSFADEDKNLLTRETVDDLAREYMRLRGETGVMLGAAHRDKEHIHLHFCVSALHFRTGKSFGLSKEKLQELKLSFQEYHRRHYPEIAKSFPDHGSNKQYQRPSQWYAQQREQIISQVRQCFAQAKSQNEFLDLLRNADLHHYERSGKPTGITVDGTKFRFSRLLDGKTFEDLPIDRADKQSGLDEIRTIRERQVEQNKPRRETEGRER